MFEDLLASFIADQELRRMSKSTIEAGYCRLKMFLSWTSESKIDPLQITREGLLAYLLHMQGLGHKSATLQKDFSSLVSFYELLEEQGKSNSASQVKAIQKKYMRSYKPDAEERQIISIEQAAQMVAATIDTRDRAILLLLLKTGIRRGELVSLDVADISLERMSILLKPIAKRSNRLVFFDGEAKEALQRWLKAREHRAAPNETALFLGEVGKRLQKKGVQNAIVRAAERVELHTPGAPLDQRFGPHCCRHWFTTHLLRSGCPREYVQLLRGDSIKEAVDIYYHLDLDDVKKSYLTHIPRLGV